MILINPIEWLVKEILFKDAENHFNLVKLLMGGRGASKKMFRVCLRAGLRVSAAYRMKAINSAAINQRGKERRTQV